MSVDGEPLHVSGGMAGAPRSRRRSPEHRFQAWVDRLIDRIVVPPMFVTGIDHASQTTDNARARMAGRGIKFGLPDVFVCQASRPSVPDDVLVTSTCLWLELKRGTGLSSAQEGVHKALRAAGQSVAVCSSMAGVVAALRNYGFDVHGNADNIAAEYEARASSGGGKPKRTTSKPRSRFTSRDRKAAQSYARTVVG